MGDQLWRERHLDTCFAPLLGKSREGTDWEKILRVLALCCPATENPVESRADVVATFDPRWSKPPHINAPNPSPAPAAEIGVKTSALLSEKFFVPLASARGIPVRFGVRIDRCAVRRGTTAPSFSQAVCRRRRGSR